MLDVPNFGSASHTGPYKVRTGGSSPDVTAVDQVNSIT